jgi:hypothetical protein
MSTTTPNLTLTLYDASADQAVTFATFRSVWGGTATTSNFYRIDTAWAGLDTRITTLESYRGAIPVDLGYISANYYEATISAITAYDLGMTIIVDVDTTTSGTVTANISSLGTKSLMKYDSTGTAINLTGSDLVVGRRYLFIYDGARWVWVSANSADQIQIVGTAGNVVTVGSTNNLDGTVTQSVLVSGTITSATDKATPVGADSFGITDSATSNTLKKATLTNVATAVNALYTPPTASTTVSGDIEIAIASETSTGTDATRAVSPDALAGSTFGEKNMGLSVFTSDVAVEVGNGLIGIPVPASINGMNIVDVLATVHTLGVTGTTNVQVRRRRLGTDVDVLSTLITIASQYFASDGVINTANDDLSTGDVLYIDVDVVHTTPPNGLSVVITARLP